VLSKPWSGIADAMLTADVLDAYAKAHHLSRSGFLAKAAVSEMERQ